VLRRFCIRFGRACVPSVNGALPAASGLSLVRVDRLEQIRLPRVGACAAPGATCCSSVRALAPMAGAWMFRRVHRAGRDGRAGRPRTVARGGRDRQSRLERVLGIYPDVYGRERSPSLTFSFVARMRGDGAAVQAGDDAGGLRLVLPPGAPPPAGLQNNREALGSSSGTSACAGGCGVKLQTSHPSS